MVRVDTGRKETGDGEQGFAGLFSPGRCLARKPPADSSESDRCLTRCFGPGALPPRLTDPTQRPRGHVRQAPRSAACHSRGAGRAAHRQPGSHGNLCSSHCRAGPAPCTWSCSSGHGASGRRPIAAAAGGDGRRSCPGHSGAHCVLCQRLPPRQNQFHVKMVWFFLFIQ